MTHAKLREAAEAATPGDLDTVPNPPSEYGGHSVGSYECPACQGSGEVEGETYCNFDGLALGVQFFGIGNAFKNYETYFRAANPAAVLALLDEIAELRAENDTLTTGGIVEVAVRNSSVSDYVQHWEGRAAKAEAELSAARAGLDQSAGLFDDLAAGSDVLGHPAMAASARSFAQAARRAAITGGE